MGGRFDRSALERQIVSPQTRNPNTIMPSYARVPQKVLARVRKYIVDTARAEGEKVNQRFFSEQ